jgi:hypothetical protein
MIVWYLIPGRDPEFLWGWGFGERVISCRVRCVICDARGKFWGLPDQIDVDLIAAILPERPRPVQRAADPPGRGLSNRGDGGVVAARLARVPGRDRPTTTASAGHQGRRS